MVASEGAAPLGARPRTAPWRARAGVGGSAVSAVGRLGQLTSGRDQLLRQFLPLSRQLARRYRDGQDCEDLEQVAALGLLKAIDRFDPDRGVAFSTLDRKSVV